MKKFKGLIGASLLVFSSLSLVSLSACKSEEVNNNEQKDPIIEEGSLTIFNKDNSISIKFSYDKNLVSLTHDDLTNLISGDNYSFSLSVKDSSLNVIDSVKANDSTISPFAGGKYYFSLKEGENKVDITLKNIDVGYKKEDNVGNKATYYDIWKNTGYPHPNSVGNQKMLVVPVNIKGYEKYATDENLNNIKKAFFGNDNKYLSLSNYYKESSYNKLNITGEVTPWFNVDLTFDEISKKETNGDLGTYYVLDKAVEWVQKSINLSDYDVDKDGFIDSIYLIYSAPSYVDKEDTSTNKYSTLAWNFTFYNKNNKDKGNVASPLSMTYSWSSLSMLNQDSDLKGEDTHTYIHEFGHQLGLTDYYDTTSSAMIKFTPMGRIDMMDDSVGDHSAFSKFALGWVSPKRVYGVNGELNIDLSSFSKDGDFLILTGYNQKRGDEYNGTPFDEYVILEYLTLDNKINALIQLMVIIPQQLAEILNYITLKIKELGSLILTLEQLTKKVLTLIKLKKCIE